MVDVSSVLSLTVIFKSLMMCNLFLFIIFQIQKKVIVIQKSEVSLNSFFYMYILTMFLTVWFCLEPILASDEINRAQSLDELHTRLAAIRGKDF